MPKADGTSAAWAPRAMLPPFKGRLAIAVLAFVPVLIPATFLGILEYFTSPKESERKGYEIGCDPLGGVWVYRFRVYQTPHNNQYRIDHTGPYGALGFRPSIWNTNYAITINVAFGDLSFSAAKAIDVAWDFVVGRGAQVICAIALYHIFRGPISEDFMVLPRPYDVVLAFQYSTASTHSLFHYVEYAWQLGRRRARQCFHIWLLVLSTTYVLLLPTLLSAMSGYQAKTRAVIPVEKNTYISASHLSPVCDVIIADAGRVGLGDNFCWSTTTNSAIRDSLIAYGDELGDCAGSTKTMTNASAITKWCDIASTFKYSGQVYHLNAPSLSFIDQYDTSRFFGYNGRGFTDDYLREYGECQPGNAYEWGFSFILTFATLVLTLLMFLVLYIYWYRVHTRCDTAYARKIFGQHHTAMTVGTLMMEEAEEPIVNTDDNHLDEHPKK